LFFNLLQGIYFHGWAALVVLGLLVVEALKSRSHIPHSEFSGRVIGPSHRTLLENTQHSREIDVHPPDRIRTHNPSKRQSHTHALDRAAARIEAGGKLIG